MTCLIIWDDPARSRSHIYTDSATREHQGGPMGYCAKAAPIPQVNAVFVGCGHPWINQRIASHILFHHLMDFHDLVVKIQRHLPVFRAQFLDFAASKGVDIRLDQVSASCSLVSPGKTVTLVPQLDFKAVSLPGGVWVDPCIRGQGQCDGASIQDDEAAADVMRKAGADNPERHIGGPCVRYTVKPDGIDVVTVGAADGEPTGAYRRITDPDNAPAPAAHERRAPGEWQVPRPSAGRGRGKPGRNDSCPCGSGRKAKRCCGA